MEGLGIHPLLRQGWGLKNETDAFCRLQSAGRDASRRELTEILHESYVAMLHNVLQSLSSLLSLVSKQLFFCSLYCCCINLFRNNIRLCLFWICSAKARALYHPALTTSHDCRVVILDTKVPPLCLCSPTWIFSRWSHDFWFASMQMKWVFSTFTGWKSPHLEPWQVDAETFHCSHQRAQILTPNYVRFKH